MHLHIFLVSWITVTFVRDTKQDTGVCGWDENSIHIGNGSVQCPRPRKKATDGALSLDKAIACFWSCFSFQSILSLSWGMMCLARAKITGLRHQSRQKPFWKWTGQTEWEKSDKDAPFKPDWPPGLHPCHHVPDYAPSHQIHTLPVASIAYWWTNITYINFLIPDNDCEVWPLRLQKNQSRRTFIWAC